MPQPGSPPHRVVGHGESGLPRPASAPQAPFTSMHGFGHYHDTDRKVDGAWRIAGCKLTRIRVAFKD